MAMNVVVEFEGPTVCIRVQVQGCGSHTIGFAWRRGCVATVLPVSCDLRLNDSAVDGRQRAVPVSKTARVFDVRRRQGLIFVFFPVS